MADLNRKMAEGHTVSDLDTVIDEVYGARGEYDTLGDRLDEIDTVIDTAKLGIHYKGEVDYYSNLPTTGVSIGDAYTVKYSGSSGTTPDGTEYVWGTVSGTNQWINFSKDSYTKAEVDALLALKQNALTTAQLAAVNSGIDREKVEQIATNESNILYNANMGVKNVVPLKTSVNTNNPDVTFVKNADKSYTLTISATTSTEVRFDISDVFELDSNIRYVLSGNPSSGAVRLILAEAAAPYTWIEQQFNDDPITITPVANKVYKLIVYIYANTDTTTLTIKPMVCPKSLYDGNSSYQPYSLPNAELTDTLQKLGGKQYEIALSNLTFNTTSAGLYESNTIDVSADFSSLFAVTMIDFSACPNVAFNCLIKNKNGIRVVVCDPTVPATLTFGSTSKIWILAYGWKV